MGRKCIPEELILAALSDEFRTLGEIADIIGGDCRDGLRSTLARMGKAGTVDVQRRTQYNGYAYRLPGMTRKERIAHEWLHKRPPTTGVGNGRV